MGRAGLAAGKAARAYSHIAAPTLKEAIYGRVLRHQVPQLRRPHVLPPANPQLRLRLLRGEHALGRGRTGAGTCHGHPPYAASGGRRPAEADARLAARARAGFRLVLLQALLAQHVAARAAAMGRPRNRRRVPKRRARKRSLPVLRGSVRGQIHPKRVRVPLVRQQDRRCRPAQTRHVQQTAFHGNWSGIHP